MASWELLDSGRWGVLFLDKVRGVLVKVEKRQQGFYSLALLSVLIFTVF
jgi:hypothetical protein